MTNYSEVSKEDVDHYFNSLREIEHRLLKNFSKEKALELAIESYKAILLSKQNELMQRAFVVYPSDKYPSGL